jgi:hypothetical protein
MKSVYRQFGPMKKVSFIPLNITGHGYEFSFNQNHDILDALEILTARQKNSILLLTKKHNIRWIKAILRRSRFVYGGWLPDHPTITYVWTFILVGSSDNIGSVWVSREERKDKEAIIKVYVNGKSMSAPISKIVQMDNIFKG